MCVSVRNRELQKREAYSGRVNTKKEKKEGREREEYEIKEKSREIERNQRIEEEEEKGKRIKRQRNIFELMIYWVAVEMREVHKKAKYTDK